MNKRSAMLLIGAALTTLSAVSMASAQPPRRGGGPSGGGQSGSAPPPRCPPAAAFEACSGASDGDSCSFAGRGGEEVTGTCFTVEDGSAVCVPEGAPAPGSDDGGGN